MVSAARTTAFCCLLLNLAVFIDATQSTDNETNPDEPATSSGGPGEEAPRWGYRAPKGPEHWFEDYAACGSSALAHQSPININEQNTIPTHFPWLQLQGYGSTEKVTITARNTGNTAEFDFLGGNYKISGGGLQGSFQLKHLHFHWGATSSTGSEHKIDNKGSAMEMQMIHYNSLFRYFDEAATHHNGLAILAFFVDVTPEKNENLEPLVHVLRFIGNYDEQILVPKPISVLSLLPNDMQSFFSYSGGMTTPPCSETVTWIVFKEHINISESQLRIFRGLMSRDRDADGGPSKPYLPMVNNYRPLQGLRGRNIFQNMPHFDEKKILSRASTRRASTFTVGFVCSLTAVFKGANFYFIKH